MDTSCYIAFLLLTFLLCSQLGKGWTVDDPTDGFTQLPFNTSFYHIQKPYDLPVDQRYSFEDGVHKLWVYSTDKPLSRNSPTKPRTEIIISEVIAFEGQFNAETLKPLGLWSDFQWEAWVYIQYKNDIGIWQFEGYGYVPQGTSGVCIMQDFGATLPHNTTFILTIYNGALSYFNQTVLVPNIYNRWFRLNVIHYVEASKLKVYVDGVFLYEAPGKGGNFHYFKCGVYTQDNASYYMESRWKGIKIFKLCG